jgi:hypothetical protein
MRPPRTAQRLIRSWAGVVGMGRAKPETAVGASSVATALSPNSRRPPDASKPRRGPGHCGRGLAWVQDQPAAPSLPSASSPALATLAPVTCTPCPRGGRRRHRRRCPAPGVRDQHADRPPPPGQGRAGPHRRLPAPRGPPLAGRRISAGKATGRKHPGKDLPTKKCATFSPAGVQLGSRPQVQRRLPAETKDLPRSSSRQVLRVALLSAAADLDFRRCAPDARPSCSNPTALTLPSWGTARTVRQGRTAPKNRPAHRTNSNWTATPGTSAVSLSTRTVRPVGP